MSPRSVFLSLYPDAEQTIAEIASPQLERTAEAIAGRIAENVPVVDGVMRASYEVSVSAGEGQARVYPGSPFWHWMEYGTRYNSAYRPIQRAAESTGVRYEPR